MIKRIVLSTDQSKLSKVLTAQVGQPLEPEKIIDHCKKILSFMRQCNVVAAAVRECGVSPDEPIEKMLVTFTKGEQGCKITSWSTAADNNNQDGETGHTLQMDDITLSIVTTADHPK